MAQPRKNQSLFSFARETRDTLRDVFVAKPLAWWGEARVKMSDLPKTNFDLGCEIAVSGGALSAAELSEGVV
jgi:hypothetical protein